jgi:beta-N-acetylhexosaminidase
VVRCREHAEWARELADRSVTLVKDTAGLLPLSPQNTKRVLLEILGEYPSTERVTRKMQRLLKEHGFSVTLYEREDFEKGVDNVTQFREKYDLVIYVANIENASNQTTTRLNWYTFWGQGNNVPWFAEEVPVLFISLANPYHLLDVPMLKTYINAYSNNDDVMEAVVEKVMGRSPFTGISPVDPFCGREELSY